MPVHSDTVLVKLEGQGHGSKFMIAGRNKSSAAAGTADHGVVRVKCSEVYYSES